MDFIGWKFSFSQIWKYEFQSPTSILGQSGHFAVEVTHRLLWEFIFFYRSKFKISSVNLPAFEVLGRTEAEPQGSEAGGWFVAQGSLPFMGGTEGLVPHGSTGLGTAPSGRRERHVEGGGVKTHPSSDNWTRRQAQGLYYIGLRIV